MCSQVKDVVLLYGEQGSGLKISTSFYYCEIMDKHRIVEDYIRPGGVSSVHTPSQLPADDEKARNPFVKALVAKDVATAAALLATHGADVLKSPRLVSHLHCRNSDYVK
jgi:hypothetical protein